MNVVPFYFTNKPYKIGDICVTGSKPLLIDASNIINAFTFKIKNYHEINLNYYIVDDIKIIEYQPPGKDYPKIEYNFTITKIYRFIDHLDDFDQATRLRIITTRAQEVFYYCNDGEQFTITEEEQFIVVGNNPNNVKFIKNPSRRVQFEIFMNHPIIEIEDCDASLKKECQRRLKEINRLYNYE